MKLKQTIAICFLLSVSATIFGQSDNDTKDFIFEKYKENFIEIYSSSYIFFNNSILKKDAEYFANKTLNDFEFNNFFSCVSDIPVGIDEPEVISLIETIDIRDITKVSTTKQSDNNYLISIYLSGKYESIRIVYNSKTKEKKTKNYLPIMKITIENNPEVAKQIKKAIIHLGKLRNITIKDGDLF